MRGRGSKLLRGGSICVGVLSPLMRGRGSKPRRAPRWVERADVAPHAGAWIETRSRRKRLRRMTSPLMRGRGSKQIAVALFDVGVDVAPHAVAWIETAISATKGTRRYVAPHAGASAPLRRVSLPGSARADVRDPDRRPHSPCPPRHAQVYTRYLLPGGVA
jgi:hypothetical protein